MADSSWRLSVVRDNATNAVLMPRGKRWVAWSIDPTGRGMKEKIIVLCLMGASKYLDTPHSCTYRWCMEAPCRSQSSIPL